MKKLYLILVFICIGCLSFAEKTVATDKAEKIDIAKNIEQMEEIFKGVKNEKDEFWRNSSASGDCLFLLGAIESLKSEKMSPKEKEMLNSLKKRITAFVKQRWGKNPPVAVKANIGFCAVGNNKQQVDFKPKPLNANIFHYIPGGPLKWFTLNDINRQNINDLIEAINIASKIRESLPLILPNNISQKMFSKLMKNINVRYLDFIGSESINDISALEYSTNLKELRLFINKGMKGFEALNKLHKLEILEIESNRLFLNDLTFLGKLPSLKILKISSSNIKKLVGLKNFPNLQELTIIGTEIEGDLSPVTNTKKLKIFKLIFTVYPHDGKDITSLGNLSKLKVLVLRNNINNIAPLAKLQNLEELYLSVVKGTDLSPICQLKKLRYLSPPYWIKNLKFLEKSINLERLCLNCTKLDDISGIAKLKKLKRLDLSYCEKIKDYSPIGELDQLQVLYLSGTNVKNIAFLKNLKNLKVLHIAGNKHIKDFTPLLRLSNLKQLIIADCKWFDKSMKEKVKKELPNCSVRFTFLCICEEGEKDAAFFE